MPVKQALADRLHTKAGAFTALVVITIATILIPGLVIAGLGYSSAAGVSAIAALGAFIARISHSTRAALVFAAVAAIGGALTVFGAGNPWLSAALFMAFGLIAGMSTTAGLHGAFAYLPIAAGFALGTTPTLERTIWANALVLAGLVLASALFATAIARVIASKMPEMKRNTVSPEVGRLYGLLLGLMLATAAWFVSADHLAHSGSWVILTLVVIIQPSLHRSWVKAFHRAAGTILGFFIAIGVATTIQNPTLLYVAGGIAAVLAIVALVGHQPYWLYVTALTVAIAILEGSSSSILDTAQERLWATVVAATAALVVMAVLALFAKRVGASPTTA